MKSESKIGAKGHLTLWDLTPLDKQLVLAGRKPFVDFIPSGRRLMGDDNVIVDLGDQRIAELVGGLSSDFVDTMAIGDGGVSLGDPTVPLAPTKTDTALGHELLRKTPITATLVTTPDYQIEFTQTFFTTDPDLDPFLGASVVNEAGLFCSDGVMFSRKTWVPLPFSSVDRVGIIATWKLHVL